MKSFNQGLCILILICMTTALFPFATAADVTELTLSNIYMDNMVLQANKEVKITGRAPSGSKITVTFSSGIGSHTANASADSGGSFSAVFAETFAPGYTEYVLTVTDGVTSETFSNIVFGDVYLLAGQSNMAWPVAYYLGNTAGDERTAVQAAINTADNRYLRFIDLKRDWNTS